MRLGFFGNIANDAYILAKLLRDRGLDAELVLDPHDQFAFSQPIWEDCDLIIDREHLMATTIDRDFWTDKARGLGWANPSWVRDIGGGSLSKLQVAQSGLTHPTVALRAIVNAGRSKDAIKLALRNLHTVRSLSEFGLLVVYGLGPIYALFSGAPYIFIPFGGDVTIEPFRTDPVGALQRKAISKAHKVMVGDPDFITYIKKLGLNNDWVYFPFPVDPTKYAPTNTQEDKKTVRSMLPESAQNKFIFFMPSRQDFYWKGTDRALKAFLKLCEERDDVVLVTPSWGVDTAKALEMVRATSRKERVVFLPYAISKCGLIKFIHASDLVLDQFVLGSYGTSTIEAMACGKAVVTHIDHEKYRSHLKQLPPNLEARTEDEIREKMRWALAHHEVLDEVGAKSRQWAVTQHYEKSIEIMMGVLREFEETKRG